MAITIVTAYTDPAQNSYATLEEATAYIDGGVADPAAWDDAADDEVRKAVLVAAFRALNRITMWLGYKTTASQVGAWPRTGVEVPGGFLEVNGPDWGELTSTVIPQALKEAQVLEALALLEFRQDAGAHKRRIRAAQGVVGASVAGLSESLTAPPRFAQRNLASPDAYGLIRPYIATAGGVNTRGGSRNRWNVTEMTGGL